MIKLYSKLVSPFSFSAGWHHKKTNTIYWVIAGLLLTASFVLKSNLVFDIPFTLFLLPLIGYEMMTSEVKYMRASSKRTIRLLQYFFITFHLVLLTKLIVDIMLLAGLEINMF